jgi:protein-disulfide isomerase
MDRILVFAVVVAIAGVAVAVLTRRSRPDVPTQSGWRVPAQLDRNDFPSPHLAWLVVAFTSATCDTCADIWPKVDALAGPEVSVAQMDAIDDKALHERYGIEAVPTVVVADRAGVVRAHFVGPVTASELWAVVADVRDHDAPPVIDD